MMQARMATSMSELSSTVRELSIEEIDSASGGMGPITCRIEVCPGGLGEIREDCVTYTGVEGWV